MTDRPSPNPENTMRAMTDADRTPEFKEKREGIVETVDTFLKDVLELQMKGVVIKGGAILWQPRITETDIGPTGPNTKLRVTEARPGVSLIGDGKSSPLSLQYVGEGVRIRVQGSDPLVRMTEDSVYSGSPNEVVASVYREEGQNYFGVDVKGDGSVSRRYFRETDGMNVGSAILQSGDFDIVATGVNQILAELIPTELRS